jgi:hypothetical protein
MAKMKRTNGHAPRGRMRLYQSYMFRGKDPIIDEMRTMTQKLSENRKLSNKILRQIENDGGPTVGCQRGWYFGVTRRPNNCSIEAAGRTLGKKRVWVDL